MRVARTILMLVVCSLPWAWFAAPVPTDVGGGDGAGTIDVSLRVAMRQHSGSGTLKEACRVGYSVRACTDFPKEVIECDCVARGGAWVIEGRAIVNAVIHVAVSQPMETTLKHERAHIRDLEEGLREYLASIEVKRFETKPACDAYAGVLAGSPHLRLVMNRLRVASNQKFGCDRKGSY